eukprot:scaffold530900_cov51-Attheya_sp.AAC.1
MMRFIALVLLVATVVNAAEFTEDQRRRSQERLESYRNRKLRDHPMRKLAPDVRVIHSHPGTGSQRQGPQLKAMLIRKREERKVRLSELIEERSQQIDDHASGRRLLNDEDHSRVLKQHKNFNWKLDQMENEDPE